MDGIPVSIMLAALAILLAVLFIMCGSWIEPLLFLMTIGIAVIINAGTNYFLGSVSNITNMISALLQLVLSMDYSIILMNRYRQELEKDSDRAKAMSTALHQAFSSIAGSSVTTIVGLLALVFMSFKIGQDLGIVLAKGVLISMLCVFTVLPGLILMCTKLIQKTSKRVPRIPMGGLGRLSHKFRIPVTIVFVLLFTGSYIFQSQTQMAFTLTNEDPIAKIFPNSNTIVLVYHNEDDDTVTRLAEQLTENDEQVKAAVSYSTMPGKQYTAEELSDVLSSMSDELELNPELLQILYYDYYCPVDTVTMTASQFLHFLADDVRNNDLVADKFDDDMSDKIDLISEFADAENLTEKKSVQELSDIFDMDTDMIEKLLLLYYTNHDGTDVGSMTLHTFADFIVNEVAQNPDYSSMFDGNTLSMTDTLLTFTDTAEMTTPYTYQNIANLLGMEEDTAKLLFVYYYALQDSYNPDTMTITEFVDLIQNNIAQNPVFSSYINESTVSRITMLNTFTDKNNIQAQKTSAELSRMLGIDQTMTEQIFTAAFPADVSNKTMPFAEFTEFLVNDILNAPAYSSKFDDTSKAQLIQMNMLVQSAASDTKLSASQTAQIFSMDEVQIEQLYAMASVNEMSLSEFTGLLVNQILPNENYASMFTDTQKVQIRQMYALVTAAASNQPLTAIQSAQALNMDEVTVTQLFTLYFTDITDKTMSAVEPANFLVNNMSSMLNATTFGQLQLIQNIMNGVLNNKAYTYTEMSDMFGMNSDMMKMLYTFRNSLGDTSSWKLSTQTVVHFLLDNTEQFASVMGSNTDQLYLLQNLIDNSVAETSFTYDSLSELLNIDAVQLRQLYLLYQTEHSNTDDWGISLDTFVNFIQQEVLSNDDYADQMSEDAADLLSTARTLMNAVLSDQKYNTAELTTLFGNLTDKLDENTVELLVMFYGSQNFSNPEWTLSIHQLFNHLSDNIFNDPRFENFLDDDMRNVITENRSTIDDGIAQLKGKDYSRLILSTAYSDESEETSRFIGNLVTTCNNELTDDYYLIGSSVMNYEMENSFDDEMTLITLITAISIFIVVAITFRSLIIPLILVLIVQCGVYITVSVIGLQGYSIYYLENRRTMPVKDALTAAYNGSIHTILTSGLILIL